MENIGLEAIFETKEFQRGLAKYLQGLGVASSETEKSAGEMGGFQKEFSNFASTLLTGLGLGVAGGIGAMLATGLVNVFKNAVTSVSESIREIFQTVVTEISNFVEQGISDAARLQQVMISMQALVARELAMTDQFANAEEAMASALPVSQALYEELKNLAILSPFRAENIFTAYQTAAAFGVQTQMATDLVQAITDIAAVSPLGVDAINRITYNWSQMQRQGKILAVDVRQLGLAGLSVADIFRTQLSMSIDEVNAALESGRMTMEEVTEAFIRYSEENFGGAAERMQRSAMGIKATFEDLIYFASVDIFGPSLETATDFLADILMWANRIIESGALQKIGITLQVITEDVINFAKQGIYWIEDFLGITILSTDELARRAPVSIDQMTQTAGDKLKSFTWEVFQWGINTAVMFAQGIIEGAADALVLAMNFISSVLEAFLGPGSPPKVAPNIDVWGTQAMTEWLKGMTEADFDILNAIQTPLSRALSQLGIDSDAALKITQKISEQIANALKQIELTGSYDDAFLNTIMSSAGKYGLELKELVRLQLELAKATRAVEQAQKKLNAAEEKYEDADENVRKLVDEYNKLFRAGASDEVLKKKLAEINAEEDRRKEAVLSKKEAEEELDIAKKREEEISNFVNIQKKLVDQMLKLTNFAGDLTANLKGASDVAANIAFPAFEDDGGLRKKIRNAFDLEDFKKEIEESLQGLFDPLTEAWDENVAPKLSEMEGSFKRLASNINNLISPIIKFGEGVGDMLPEGMAERLPRFLGQLTGGTIIIGLGLLALAIGGVTAAIVGLALVAGAPLILPLATVATSIWLIIHGLTELKTKLEEAGIDTTSFGTIVNDTWLLIKDSISQKVEDIKTKLGETWNTIKTSALTKWNEIKTAILTPFSETKQEIINKMTELDPEWRENWATIKNVASNKWSELKLDIQTKLLGIKTNIATSIEDIKTKLSERWSEIKEDATTSWGELRNIISNALVQVRVAIGEKITSIKQKAQEVIDGIKEAFTGFISNAVSLGEDIIQGIIKGMGNIKQALIKFAAQLITDALRAMVGASDSNSPSGESERQVGEPLGLGVAVGIRNEAETVMRAVRDLVSLENAGNLIGGNAGKQVGSSMISNVSHHYATTTINMGDNYIRDNMDLALLRSDMRDMFAQETVGL